MEIYGEERIGHPSSINFYQKIYSILILNIRQNYLHNYLKTDS